jgi:hypothetical protein
MCTSVFCSEAGAAAAADVLRACVAALLVCLAVAGVAAAGLACCVNLFFWAVPARTWSAAAAFSVNFTSSSPSSPPWEKRIEKSVEARLGSVSALGEPGWEPECLREAATEAAAEAIFLLAAERAAISTVTAAVLTL